MIDWARHSHPGGGPQPDKEPNVATNITSKLSREFEHRSRRASVTSQIISNLANTYFGDVEIIEILEELLDRYKQEQQFEKPQKDTFK